MCLVVNKNAKIKPAEKDITVYKVMLKISDNEYVTPYQKMKVNNPVKGMSIKAEGEISRKGCYYDNKNLHEINGGMLHAYSQSEAAKDHTKYTMAVFKQFIWQMTIPKGTEYIEGEYSEIAAKEMVFEKILDDEDIHSATFW